MPKTFDPDFDNVYSTAVYVMFAADDAGNAKPGTAPGSNVDPFTFVSGTRRTVASIPSFVNFTIVTPASTCVASSYGYRLMDNPALPPDVTVTNLEAEPPCMPWRSAPKPRFSFNPECRLPG